MARPHVGMLVALLLAFSAPARANAEVLDLAPARACLDRNTPKTTLSFRAEFVKVDRVGGERKSRAAVLGKKFADGLRRAVLRFDRPPEMRGTAMLMIEGADGPSDFYVWSSDERRVRRIAGRSNSGLFGTDFSYDDFENWRAFQKHGQAERLPDAKVAGRPVYVLANAAAPGEESSYERVVMSIDQDTCVVLQVDSFEPGGRLRKVLRADPAKVERVGEFSMASALELEDVVDQTRTRVSIDEIKLDANVPDVRFRPADLAGG
ncbi:MAG TPA: outer membrane lipoprotein-sorting protein [Myxococcota bacterium]|nr:outer membrane lipoprotein-sorting protein [Myxococcota bacterium]